ncbi:MAG: endonuclease/exonuclease/phosphatase family protein [Rhizobiales bacterium]|nr:endonuclease/exonuclease/phosphatase family protein [Hyphomicrobiales bacterium]
MRIATFNVQNLRLRHPSGRSRLDGARDRDVLEDALPQAIALDFADRRLTAAVLAHAGADIVCLQEVFDLQSLDYFHDHLLRRACGHDFPYRYCFPGNDGAGRDVALMSRREVAGVKSHAKLTATDLELADLPGRKPHTPVFCRDCLMARIGPLTLFVCHFKAPWPDPEAAWPVRRFEALAVRRLIERRFKGDPDALWLVAGDLNEPGDTSGSESAIAPLTRDFAVDLLERLPEAERWTYYDRGSKRYSRPDSFLASPGLAARWPDARPYAMRVGLPREAGRYEGPRLPDVGLHRPRASDHALLVVEFAGL